MIGFANSYGFLEIINDALIEKEMEPLENNYISVGVNQDYEESLKLTEGLLNSYIYAQQEDPAISLDFTEWLGSMEIEHYFKEQCLSAEIRELINFCVLYAMGKNEQELLTHILLNLIFGNSKDTLTDTVKSCTYYVGIPKTLSTLKLLSSVTEEEIK